MHWLKENKQNNVYIFNRKTVIMFLILKHKQIEYATQYTCSLICTKGASEGASERLPTRFIHPKSKQLYCAF